MQFAALSERVSEGFHALSDQTRIGILLQLARGERCVCDLTEALGLTQPLLSFHLKVLRRAGLVRARREGRWAYYTLEPGGLKALRQVLDRFETAAARLLPLGRGGCCD